ncbi:MAG: HNH endonuclease [Caldilinea sp.]
MIPVQRTSMPLVLQRNAAGWQTALDAVLRLPNATKKDIAKAQNKYRHHTVKQALIAMFHGKCAYCESKITVVTYGSIEHFYPKSAYVALTFSWENLLLACDICNDSGHKGAQFPLDRGGRPLLIDPTDGVIDPRSHLDFVWDAVAGLASIFGRDERGRTVELTFDLNGIRGRRELIDHRSRYVRRLFALLRFAQQGDAEAAVLLREAVQPDAEYCAFARVYIQPYLS